MRHGWLREIGAGGRHQTGILRIPNLWPFPNVPAPHRPPEDRVHGLNREDRGDDENEEVGGRGCWVCCCVRSCSEGGREWMHGMVVSTMGKRWVQRAGNREGRMVAASELL
eukprot:2356908-Rhodomonas_salina.1